MRFWQLLVQRHSILIQKREKSKRSQKKLNETAAGFMFSDAENDNYRPNPNKQKQ